MKQYKILYAILGIIIGLFFMFNMDILNGWKNYGKDYARTLLYYRYTNHDRQKMT